MCAGIVTCLSGILIAFDAMAAPLAVMPNVLAGGLAFLVGVAGVITGRELFHVRRVWLGWIAGIALVLTLGMYVIGPGLAVVGLVYLGLAERESEFTTNQTVRTA